MAESSLRPFEKELMRMAMLRHEQTFKQQVSELHRLYRVQKIMMKDIESRSLQEWRRKLHLKQPAEAIVESEIELTLGPSSSSHCRRKKLEMQQASSSSTQSSYIYRAFDLEDEMRVERLRQPPWAFQIVSL